MDEFEIPHPIVSNAPIAVAKFDEAQLSTGEPESPPSLISTILYLQECVESNNKPKKLEHDSKMSGVGRCLLLANNSSDVQDIDQQQAPIYKPIKKVQAIGQNLNQLCSIEEQDQVMNSYYTRHTLVTYGTMEDSPMWTIGRKTVI
jgi:hypothetical protein